MAKVKKFTTVKQLIKQAVGEVTQEQMEKAKKRYKMKLKDLGRAKQVVSNLERELEDLEMELTNEFSE